MGRAGTPPPIGRRGGTNHPTEPALVRARGHQRSLHGATWLSMRLKGTRRFLGALALHAAMPRTASHSWRRTSADRPRCPVRPGRRCILEGGGWAPCERELSQHLRGNVLVSYRKSSDSPSHLHPFNRIWARCGSQTLGSTSEGLRLLRVGEGTLEGGSGRQVALTRSGKRLQRPLVSHHLTSNAPADLFPSTAGALDQDSLKPRGLPGGGGTPGATPWISAMVVAQSLLRRGGGAVLPLWSWHLSG